MTILKAMEFHNHNLPYFPKAWLAIFHNEEK
jgi:hypothetical protein